MRSWFLISVSLFAILSPGFAQMGGFQPPTCELVPLPHQEMSFQIDGVEHLRWHAGEDTPRPFIFPFKGPSGVSLTRMGHPGAPNHDHHRSIWLAHQDINGLDFWADGKGTSIRQKQWLAYEEGDSEAVMAVRLGWYDPEGVEVMEQDLVLALRPLDFNEQELEIQSTFRVPKGRQEVVLGKTNFGFLAVRVAKSISAHFGGGQLTSSERVTGEIELFEKPARWMDYSGPVANGEGVRRISSIEGITCFDHPSNPGFPTSWHVRDDGWMGAAFSLKEGRRLSEGESLTLRYLLQSHSGKCEPLRADDRADAFSSRPSYEIRKSEVPHQHFDVLRSPPKPFKHMLLPDL